jgi:hypothetical protein
VARDDYAPCWIRAAEPFVLPFVLHSLGPSSAKDGPRLALCGAESFGWLCTDDIDIRGAVECEECAAVAAQM